MLNSVCQQVKTILNGLTIPGQAKTLEAWVQPPPAEIPTGPKAYIWAGTGAWKRQTMPRGPGFQEFQWPLDIWLRLLTSNQMPNVDQLQNLFVDAVIQALLTTPMPVYITDPTTGKETQMWQIGEAGKISNAPGRTTDNLRLYVYDAGISVTVKEIVQA